MPPDPSHPVDDRITRLEAEIDRLSRVNRVLMDRVERAGSATGPSLGMLHLATELSQQLDVERRALREAAIRADGANRAKSLFLANMSHEIRTPMAAILGFADLLADSETSEEERRAHVETIRRNGEHLMSLINDILDLSKIESGRMMIEYADSSIVTIISDVAALMRVRASERGISLDVEYETEVPRTLRTDPMRVRQILVNLVGNAVKFTEQGGVRVRVRMSHRSLRNLTIDVIDTGIGIEPEKMACIFDAFMQADPSMARRFGGTGLGLCISRSIVELLGYTLEARSEVGKGSIFSLTIPLTAEAACDLVEPDSPPDIERAQSSEGADGEGRPNPPDHALDGRTVLLVEDGPDNQRLISHHLRRCGAIVSIAENGSSALDLIRIAHDERTMFDLILMDMQMPELDGYAATAELRRLGCEVPIIALTAHAMEGDRERCLRAGCDDYLQKPVGRDRLIRTCAEWLAPARILRARSV